MKPLEGSRRYGLFEELEIAAFAARHAAGLLHILQELTQIVALRRLQASEANANPGGGGASRHDSAERKALDPDFPARDPKPNLDFCPALHRSCRLDQAPSDTGITQVPPDRGIRLVDPQFDRDEAPDARVVAAVVPNVRTEDVGTGRGARAGSAFLAPEVLAVPEACALISRIASRSASSRFSGAASR